MSNIMNLFNKKNPVGKWEGTIKLSFEMEESVYLLELLIKREEKIVVYDLNELNCLFEAKYKKAYTVAQYQTMSKIIMILDGISTSNIHLFSGCEYKNGKIGFEKGTYFKLCSCLIESKRTLREKGRTREKPKVLQVEEKNIKIPKNENTSTIPRQVIEQTKSAESFVNNNLNDSTIQTNSTPQVNKSNPDTGGISKEDFKKQIQAMKINKT